MERKKGAVHYGFLFAMLLGLLIVGLFLGIIFPEYFSSEEVGYDVCRSSLYLRANAPEAEILVTTVSSKEAVPLRCQTNVVSIDFKDKAKAEKLIAETMATCWSMFLEGKNQFFGGETWARNTFCLPCSRIHFDEDVIEYYSTLENKTNIQQALLKKMPGQSITFFEYLKKGFTYTKFGEDNTFKLEGSGSDSRIILPKELDPKKGDLLIFLQQTVIGTEGDEFHSNLFFFQVGQTNPDPFDVMKETFSGDGLSTGDICDRYVGILA